MGGIFQKEFQKKVLNYYDIEPINTEETQDVDR